ncbi:hypothetical protein NQD34_016487 [Periophthalmus magnuspinnatus]|nr:hypothetical protein NQD34_016487 [Periophthalmus magnuspinnatus]
MLATTGLQEENGCGIKYLWRRLSQRRPLLEWTGWMVISDTLQAYVYCIHLLETLPSSVFKNSARGMLVQDLMPFTLSFWPFFFGHCLLSLLLLSCQGELQRSCSQTVAEKVSDQCQLACQCRRYPPLPSTSTSSTPAAAPGPPSGGAHGALSPALVVRDGLYSAGNGGVCLTALPPVSCHHLLQGHQEKTTSERRKWHKSRGVRHEHPQQEGHEPQQHCGID